MFKEFQGRIVRKSCMKPTAGYSPPTASSDGRTLFQTKHEEKRSRLAWSLRTLGPKRYEDPAARSRKEAITLKGGEFRGALLSQVWMGPLIQAKTLPASPGSCIAVDWCHHKQKIIRGRKWGVRYVVVEFGVFGAPRFSVQRSQNPLKIGIWGALDWKSGRPKNAKPYHDGSDPPFAALWY